MEKTDRELIACLESLPEAAVPKGFSTNVMQQINQQHKPSSISVFRIYFPVLAACLAIVVCLSVLTFKSKVSRDGASGLIDKGAAMLSQERPEDARSLLEEAVRVSPGNADAFFFLGMNYGRLEMFDEEQEAYRKAISLKPDDLMTHYFLGHSYMNTTQWEKAVSEYEQVLSLDPGFSKANYNLGLALKLAGRTHEALAAWKNYLENRKTGGWALRAAAHLNAHGDFTYRTFPIGRQQVVMGPFNPDEERETIQLADDSLDQIGRSMRASEDLDLFVMVYVKEQPEKARTRAISIKKKILETYPDIPSERIKVSWFDQEDRVTINQESYALEESVRFLGIKNDLLNKGVKS